MARPWPLRLRSLHADFCAGQRVIERKPQPTKCPNRTPPRTRGPLLPQRNERPLYQKAPSYPKPHHPHSPSFACTKFAPPKILSRGVQNEEAALTRLGLLQRHHPFSRMRPVSKSSNQPANAQRCSQHGSQFTYPAHAVDATSGGILQQIMTPLYDHDQSGKIIPAMATKVVKPTNNGKTYTLTLRRDVKWSDGTPVTAKDFVYSLKRIVDPKTKPNSRINTMRSRIIRILSLEKSRRILWAFPHLVSTYSRFS